MFKIYEMKQTSCRQRSPSSIIDRRIQWGVGWQHVAIYHKEGKVWLVRFWMCHPYTQKCFGRQVASILLDKWMKMQNEDRCKTQMQHEDDKKCWQTDAMLHLSKINCMENASDVVNEMPHFTCAENVGYVVCLKIVCDLNNSNIYVARA